MFRFLRVQSRFILAALLLCHIEFGNAGGQNNLGIDPDRPLTQKEIDEVNKYHPLDFEKIYYFLVGKAACDELLPGFYSETYIDYLSFESKHKTLVEVISRWEPYTSWVAHIKSERPDKLFDEDLEDVCGRVASLINEMHQIPSSN